MKKKFKLTKLNADKYELYEESVQSVEFEVEFIEKMFKKYERGNCLDLREDFCATGSISAAWVKDNKRKKAYAVDLEKKVLNTAKKKILKELSDDQLRRLFLLHGNSQTFVTKKVDVVVATNFSYWVFKDRTMLKKYFKNAHKHLKNQGMLILDAFGGYEAHQELEESTVYKNFTYIWDQHKFNPINNHITCFIHFKFKDGSKIERAFKYDWRLWSLPEISECLSEVGFKNIHIYMQGWDEKNDCESEKFYKMKECDADPGWIAYIVALK